MAMHSVQKRKLLKNKCKYCKSTDELTIDHKIPLSKGGSNAPGNIQTLCRLCNQTKSDMTNGQVKVLFKWFLKIQASRIAHGKKPYTLR